MQKERVGMYLNSSNIEALNEIAEKTGLSKSAIIRFLISNARRQFQETGTINALGTSND